MTFQVQCSNCGHRSRSYNYNRADMVWRAPKEIVEAGWGSCGGVMYCPKCTKTWAERNGDRPMNDKDCTIVLCLEQMVNELRSALESAVYENGGEW